MKYILLMVRGKQGRFNMPIRKVKGGYKWGKGGKTYPTKKQAAKQAAAAYASGYKSKKSK